MKKLLILGPGCGRCRQLAQNAEIAAQELGIEFELEKITDINVIAGLRVMATPALVIDGNVKSSGKVLSVQQIKEMLREQPS